MCADAPGAGHVYALYRAVVVVVESSWTGGMVPIIALKLNNAGAAAQPPLEAHSNES